jgi:hypothetical protein
MTYGDVQSLRNTVNFGLSWAKVSSSIFGVDGDPPFALNQGCMFRAADLD